MILGYLHLVHMVMLRIDCMNVTVGGTLPANVLVRQVASAWQTRGRHVPCKSTRTSFYGYSSPLPCAPAAMEGGGWGVFCDPVWLYKKLGCRNDPYSVPTQVLRCAENVTPTTQLSKFGYCYSMQ